MSIRTMHDAVQVIARSVGIADLAPNASGAFELVFFNQVSVYFQVVGETEIEVQVRLGDGEVRLSADLVQAMLAANLDLRRGRLAVEPVTERIVYCGRVNIGQYDADSLMPAVLATVREGLAWRVEEFASLVASVTARRSTAEVFSETLMRV